MSDLVLARQAICNYQSNNGLKDMKNLASYHVQQAIEKMLKYCIYNNQPGGIKELYIQFNLFIIVLSVWSLSLPYSGDDLYTVPGMIVAFVMTIFCMYRLFFKIYKEKLRTTNVYEYERISQKEKKIIDTFFDILYPNRIDDTIIQERIAAEASQKDESPFGKKYFTYACPYCGHYKVRYATWDDKRMSVAFWGMASTKIGKAYKCEHCKKVFNE